MFHICRATKIIRLKLLFIEYSDIQYEYHQNQFVLSIKHLNINSVTLVGHSLGGYVSLAYAEKYIDKVKGLCLMNSTAREDSAERKQNRDRAIRAVKQNYKTFL